LGEARRRLEDGTAVEQPMAEEKGQHRGGATRIIFPDPLIHRAFPMNRPLIER